MRTKNRSNVAVDLFTPPPSMCFMRPVCLMECRIHPPISKDIKRCMLEWGMCVHYNYGHSNPNFYEHFVTCPFQGCQAVRA
eukprot:scaffold19933_cov18-Tisochrysis_lutea.AAC.8